VSALARLGAPCSEREGAVGPGALAPVVGTEFPVRELGARSPWGLLGLAAVLATSALGYLWDLGRAGWGYGIYAAAAQAGTKSWEAALFGSIDPSNFISVDKSPGALWVMEASSRIFGFGPWSLLVPEALEAVAAAWLVYLCVRRWASAQAGILAASATAVTPALAAVARFDGPDSLLILCMVASAYATVRAIDGGGARWAATAGGLLGAAFLAKLLEALVVAPGLLAAYLLYGPGGPGRRARHVAYAGAAAVAVGGWWPALVSFTPSSARPYVGGTKDNSVVSLIFGYDGLGRLSGSGQAPPSVLKGLAALRDDASRLFGAYFGSQGSWLVLGALVLAVGSMLVECPGASPNRTRAALVLWGGWLATGWAVLSFSQGMVHPYYTAVLAPPTAALASLSGWRLWRLRQRREARWALGAAVVASSLWAFGVLAGQGPWQWLGYAVLGAGSVAGAGWLRWSSCGRLAQGATALATALACMAGPCLYMAGEIVNPPASSDPYAAPPGAPLGGGEAPVGGSMSGLSRPSPALTELLKKGARAYRWVVATVGDLPAGGYQLATGDAAMAIGGWTGTDPAPSLSEFQEMVARHEVHYFVPAGAYGGIVIGASGAGSDACQVTEWVERNFFGRSVGGVVLYDLSGPHRHRAHARLTGCVVKGRD
jgi:4-amino-4-deoxy-L-arabinose transferase-like glycosyltransferase